MDMFNILKNFDDASSGKKPSAAGAEKDSMKALLESLSNIDECGMMPQVGSPAMAKPGSPVSMNISLNASGKENVDELMAILKGAGLSTDTVEPSMPDQERDMAAMKAIMLNPEGPGDEEEEGEVEEWANSPEGSEGEEEYKDTNYMIKDLSGGLNRQKKSYKAAQRGDNAMAVESVKERLWAALSEKKTTEGKYKSDAQRKAIHANKDKMKK